ncbi:MAG: hypothetical protein IH600_12435 [Bacteroidetes bacterium]|nr:hypothetical protein [Bacteroidota bacterium]
MDKRGETQDMRTGVIREIILMRIAFILQDVYMDPASDLSEATITAKLAFKSDPQLNELRLALERMRRDEFGRCIFCKGPIALPVLEKNPTAHFCEQCSGVLRYRTCAPRAEAFASRMNNPTESPTNSTSISG